MEPPAEKRPVKVVILSQTYTVLTAGDPREVQQLAGELDTLMHSIADRLPNADSTRIAVLASLHLADKLKRLELEVEALKSQTERCSGMLEQALADIE